ncbi:MAG: hypothetical protein IIA83_03935 [Thaumarchaeota archaeon]|nr:hypothetical protein [Nitrososphaerota archaeon]
MPNWITIKIPEDLSKEVDSFLQTKQGKMLGFPSKTQFFAESIRESLQKHTTKREESKVLEEIGLIHRQIDGYTSKIDEIRRFVEMHSFLLHSVMKMDESKEVLRESLLELEEKQKLKTN